MKTFPDLDLVFFLFSWCNKFLLEDGSGEMKCSPYILAQNGELRDKTGGRHGKDLERQIFHVEINLQLPCPSDHCHYSPTRVYKPSPMTVTPQQDHTTGPQVNEMAFASVQFLKTAVHNTQSTVLHKFDHEGQWIQGTWQNTPDCI